MRVAQRFPLQTLCAMLVCLALVDSPPRIFMLSILSTWMVERSCTYTLTGLHQSQLSCVVLYWLVSLSQSHIPARATHSRKTHIMLAIAKFPPLC